MSSARSDTVEQFHHLAIVMLRKLRNVDEANGFSGPRASALSVLVFGGARSLTELAEAERVTPATMSKLVTALEREGLVRRYPDVNDARAIRIESTAKARRILERGRARRLDVLESLLADANHAEVEAVREAAEVLEHALESA